MRCPKCNQSMREEIRHGVTLYACTNLTRPGSLNPPDPGDYCPEYLCYKRADMAALLNYPDNNDRPED